MSLLNDDIKKQLSDVFVDMTKSVNIRLFTAEDGCDSCEETVNYLTDYASTSDLISLEIFDIEKDADTAKIHDVTMTPAIVFLDDEKKDLGIKFYGIPAGHEINSLVMTTLEVGGKLSDVPEEMVSVINSIDKPVNIKVFVTLGCPHCPGAVTKAHKLALMNDNITAEMIEANTFGDISEKFNVSSVPRIFFNDTKDLLGNQHLASFIDVLKSL